MGGPGIKLRPQKLKSVFTLGKYTVEWGDLGPALRTLNKLRGFPTTIESRPEGGARKKSTPAVENSVIKGRVAEIP